MSNRACARCGAPAEAGVGTCRKCGWPLGAKAPGAGGKSSTAVVVVIGCLAGVALLGIVAAILIPNFIDALQKGRQKRTLADLRVIATALQGYSSNEVAEGNPELYPDAGSMADLEPFLVPEYLQSLRQVDGWQHEIRYLCVRDSERIRGCESFRLVSAGSDGQFAYEDDSSVLFEQQRFEATDYAHDLVVGPEGVVHGPLGSR